jgi:hypothetical protein
MKPGLSSAAFFFRKLFLPFASAFGFLVLFPFPGLAVHDFTVHPGVGSTFYPGGHGCGA